MTQNIKSLLKGVLAILFLFILLIGLTVTVFGDIIHPEPLIDHTLVLTYQGGKDTINIKYRDITWNGYGNLYITGENASKRTLLAHNIVRYEVMK